MPFVTKKLHAPTRQKAFLFLIQELGLAQPEAQRLIAKGRLSQNGVVMCNNAGFIQGDCDFIMFEPTTLGLDATFVAPDFAVYDKPSGVLVHPQNRNTPYSLNDEIKHRFGHDANVAHRIDQETSGLVLASRNKESERVLKMLFEDRKITKRYLAMVHGHLKDPLDIQEPLLRLESNNTLVRMVVKVHPEGKASRTFITPLHYFPEHNMTLVEASPFTGRTHQIRVHLFHVKHPIVGDPIYGQEEIDIVKFLDKEISPQERLSKGGATRLLLHAHALEFEYEATSYHIVSKEDFVSTCFDAMKIKKEGS
ncbi:MAG TPA: RluA family pseudouridine synthase [Sulfuricurvum sp.]|nr:RluA family pseudouridine synthase [Sulfuricurvum sp.]